MPPLPSCLKYLNCSNNQLTSLPPLPPTLKYLKCSNNQLTSLPPLPSTLIILCCSNNQLTNLPKLPRHLEELLNFNNPIYDITHANIEYPFGLMTVNRVKIINSLTLKIHKFRFLYYCLKYKKRFRDLLWITIREPKLKQHYSPSNLILLLEGVEDEDEFHTVLSNW